MRLKLANDVETKLSESITDSDTTIKVDDASTLPETPFPLTLNREEEIIYVTAVDGKTLTVDRGQENTAAKDYLTDTVLWLNFTAGAYDSISHDSKKYTDDEIDKIPDATWGNITDKPSEFKPEGHKHPISDVTGLKAGLNAKETVAESKRRAADAKQAAIDYAKGFGIDDSGEEFADFNSVMKPGFYTNGSQSVKNAPNGKGWYNMFVSSRNPNAGSQIVVERTGNTSDPRVYVRTQYSGTWSDWIELENISGAQEKAGKALSSAKSFAIPKTQKGVKNGVAPINANGKVTDADGNEVEGKVTSVNGKIGDVVVGVSADESFVDARINIIDIAIELETMKAADLTGVNANIFIETFRNLDDINLESGGYDSKNNRLEA